VKDYYNSKEMGIGFTYLNKPDKTKHSFEGSCELFSFAGTEVQGWRIKMEDAHLAITNYGGDPNAALFGVFDGHGGKLNY
jgi:protein phosphatase 1G